MHEKVNRRRTLITTAIAVALFTTLVAGAIARPASIDQANVPTKPKPADKPAPESSCLIPSWLADESARLDDVLIRLHKLQSLDPAGYKQNTPPNCAQQAFKYRVVVLTRIVAAMERR